MRTCFVHYRRLAFFALILLFVGCSSSPAIQDPSKSESDIDLHGIETGNPIIGQVLSLTPLTGSYDYSLEIVDSSHGVLSQINKTSGALSALSTQGTQSLTIVESIPVTFSVSQSGTESISATFSNGEVVVIQLTVTTTGNVVSLSLTLNGVAVGVSYEVVPVAATFSTQSLDIPFPNTNGSCSDPRNQLLTRDLNNDDVLDLVFTVSTKDKVGVILGQGKGSFGGVTYYSVGACPVGLDVADLNGDSRPDIVVANKGSDTLSLLTGQGTSGGIFQTTATVSTGDRPTRVLIGRYNNDTLSDLVVTLFGDNVIAQYLGAASGNTAGISFSLWDVGPVDTDPGPVGIVSRDFNKDGLLDVAVTCGTANTIGHILGFKNPDGSNPTIAGELSVLNSALTSSTHSAEDPALATQPGVVITDEVNGDTVTDLVSVSEGTGRLIFGVGTGNSQDGWGQSWQITTVTTPSSSLVDVAAGDFNQDGKNDIVAVSPGNDTAYLFLRQTPNLYLKGNFTSGTAVSVGDNPRAVAVGDYNGNGLLDLAILNLNDETISILTNTTGL